MDVLTLFGFCAVSAMLIFYALEDRNPHYILGLACACVVSGIYGLLQGAWPFAAVEVIWAMLALRRWQKRLAVQQSKG